LPHPPAIAYLARADLERETVVRDNRHMSTTETKDSGIPPELLAEMEAAVRAAMSRTRDPEAMRKACDEMDRIREEIFRKHGVLDIGVPAIRELRDSE
jgi:hypothetical protein